MEQNDEDSCPEDISAKDLKIRIEAQMNPTNIFKKCRNKVKNIAEKTASKFIEKNKKLNKKKNKNYQKCRFSNSIKK